MSTVEEVIDWLYQASPKEIKKMRFPKHPTGQDIMKKVTSFLDLPYEENRYTPTIEPSYEQNSTLKTDIDRMFERLDVVRKMKEMEEFKFHLIEDDEYER